MSDSEVASGYKPRPRPHAIRLHRARNLHIGGQIQMFDKLEEVALEAVPVLAEMEAEQILESMFLFLPRATFEAVRRLIKQRYHEPRDVITIKGCDVPPELRPIFVQSFAPAYRILLIK
jgi:hypothetical protein